VPVPDFTDLGGIANDGDNRHAAATGGTGPDIDFIYLGKQTGPSAAPLPPANLAILGLVCRAGILTADTAIPAFRSAAAQGGALLPGSP
jgi:hypothetical protein